MKLRYLLFTCIALHPCLGEASGDGARIYGPSPIGINVLAFHASILADANRSFDPSLVTPWFKFDTSITTIQYARTLEIGGRHVTLMGMLRLIWTSVLEAGRPGQNIGHCRKNH